MKEPTEFQYSQAWLTVLARLWYSCTQLFGSFFMAHSWELAVSLQQMTRVLQIVGFVIAIPISYVTFRAVVGKYLFPKIEEDEPPKT